SCSLKSSKTTTGSTQRPGIAKSRCTWRATIAPRRRASCGRRKCWRRFRKRGKRNEAGMMLGALCSAALAAAPLECLKGTPDADLPYQRAHRGKRTNEAGVDRVSARHCTEHGDLSVAGGTVGGSPAAAHRG